MSEYKSWVRCGLCTNNSWMHCGRDHRGMSWIRSWNCDRDHCWIICGSSVCWVRCGWHHCQWIRCRIGRGGLDRNVVRIRRRRRCVCAISIDRRPLLKVRIEQVCHQISRFLRRIVMHPSDCCDVLVDIRDIIGLIASGSGFECCCFDPRRQR